MGSTPASTSPLSSILINDFVNNPPSLSLNANILEIWNSDSTRAQHLHICTLAQIVMSVPATQVLVEQIFSQLKYILNDLRMRLSEENVSDILLLRCNSNNFESLKLKYNYLNFK